MGPKKKYVVMNLLRVHVASLTGYCNNLGLWRCFTAIDGVWWVDGYDVVGENE